MKKGKGKPSRPKGSAIKAIKWVNREMDERQKKKHRKRPYLPEG